MKKNAAFADLFEQKPEHDPGGSISTPLPKGMVGKAEFYGDNDEYRLWLSREWGDAIGFDTRNLLWIGMNPSTASADVNDPTVTREINFTKAWGYNALFKVNVMDYRATFPKDLLAPFVVARSDRNIETILKFARDADRIMVCHGIITRKLEHYAKETTDALLSAGHGKKMFCMGLTLMGKPRHTLYLASDTKPVPYP